MTAKPQWMPFSLLLMQLSLGPWLKFCSCIATTAQMDTRPAAEHDGKAAPWLAGRRRSCRWKSASGEKPRRHTAEASCVSQFGGGMSRRRRASGRAGVRAGGGTRIWFFLYVHIVTLIITIPYKLCADKYHSQHKGILQSGNIYIILDN